MNLVADILSGLSSFAIVMIIGFISVFALLTVVGRNA